MGSLGRDRYLDVYANHGERQAEWLRRGAAQKIESVRQLTEGLDIERVLELGCGTGAVISGVRELDLGTAHYGVDYSQDALDLLNARSAEVSVAQSDITEAPNPFDVDGFDLVIASHVLEHLEEPERLLQALHGVSLRFLVAEVPLEGNPLHRLKGLVRDPMQNAAGHVQFFTRSSFHHLLQSAGFEIVKERIYAPVLSRDTLRMMYGGDSAPRRLHKLLTERTLPRLLGRAWTRLYHAHLAVLAVPKAIGS